MSHGDSIEDACRRRIRGDGETEKSPAPPWAMPAAPSTASSSTRRWPIHLTAKSILQNFLFKICGCSGDWEVGLHCRGGRGERMRQQVGKGRVICALSGGVDSAVVAILIHRAIGDQTPPASSSTTACCARKRRNGRSNAFQRNLKMNLVHVDATERFLERLKGVMDPEEKRHIIGEEFVRVFEEEAAKIGQVDFLAQGTLYPDVIESALPPTKAPRR